MSETKTEWYFIVNPCAGSGKTMSHWKPAESWLLAQGIPFASAMTDYKQHAIELAREAASRGYRRIAAVGGDGSVHEIFNGICAWCIENGVQIGDFSIAVIPIGSGNDWIKSLGIKNDPIEAVRLLDGPDMGRMDVVSCSFADGKRFMVNIGGAGFDSNVCVRVNAQKELGKRSRLIYVASLIHTIFHTRTIRLRLVADGVTVFEGPCFSVALGNGKFSGGGMRQVPLADMNDGLLDFMVVPRMSLLALLPKLPLLFNGKLYKCKDVVMGTCRSLEVLPLDAESAVPVEIDGEVEGNLPVTVCNTGESIAIF